MAHSTFRGGSLHLWVGGKFAFVQDQCLVNDLDWF